MRDIYTDVVVRAVYYSLFFVAKYSISCEFAYVQCGEA